MTKANYIDWENLRNIPFFLCQVTKSGNSSVLFR